MTNRGGGPHYTPSQTEIGAFPATGVEFPQAGIVELDERHFEATKFAERRTNWSGRWSDVMDAAIDASMNSKRLAEGRLSKKMALPILSSNALSFTAYATQEILLVLALAGTAAFALERHDCFRC